MDMKIKKSLLILILVVLFTFFACLSGGCGGGGNGDGVKPETPKTNAALIDEAKYGVAEIRAEGYETRAGSGVIVYKDELKIRLITNYHVVEDAQNVKVKFLSSPDFYSAVVLGYESNFDIAVLEVGFIPDKIHVFLPAPNVTQGENVLAIGYNNTQLAAFDGIISAPEKLIYHSGRKEYLYVTQTTTTFLEGCSGGAVINSKGELTGIVSYALLTYSAGETVNTGLGYSIPINIALALYGRITGGNSRPALGFYIGGDFSVTLYLSGKELDLKLEDGVLKIGNVKNAPSFVSGAVVTRVNGYQVNGSMVAVLTEIIKTHQDTAIVCA